MVLIDEKRLYTNKDVVLYTRVQKNNVERSVCFGHH